MSERPACREVGAIAGLGIREAIIEALADIEGVDLAEVEDAVAAAGGDLMYEMDSKVAEGVLAALSVRYGVDLPGPSDLEPEQFTTLSALIQLGESAFAATEGT